MTIDAKEHIAYMSKDVEEIADNECDCSSTISSTIGILNHEGCGGDIADIDDVLDVIGYTKPIGNHICQLPTVQRNLDNDFFMISQLEKNPKEDGKDSETSSYISKKISYSNLRLQLLEDVYNALGLKSMAFEDKRNYALTSHSHDEIYNRVEWTSNPLYELCSTSRLSNLGQVQINFETLSSTDVSSNPIMSKLSSTSDAIYCPKIQIPLPPKPIIGTLKFIASPTVNRLLERNQLSTIDYSGIINVNPYDKNGNIRDDYDGWMFPNGATINNINGQLSDAALVFTGSTRTERFTLPTLSNFIQAYSQDGDLAGNLSSFPAQIGLKNHDHSVDIMKFSFTSVSLDQRTKKIWTTTGNGGTEWIHTGASGVEKTVEVKNVIAELGSRLLNNVKTEFVGTNTGNPYPTHNLLPLMIYIGGESLKFYEH